MSQSIYRGINKRRIRKRSRSSHCNISFCCLIFLTVPVVACLGFFTFHLRMRHLSSPLLLSLSAISGKTFNSFNTINQSVDPLQLYNTHCSMTFTDKCPINPIVKYWDSATDCYISPLRKLNGTISFCALKFFTVATFCIYLLSWVRQNEFLSWRMCFVFECRLAVA